MELNKIEDNFTFDAINSIETNEVKHDFHEIHNNFLKIVRIEGIPTLEMDWENLSKYNLYFYENVNNLINYNKKLVDDSYGIYGNEDFDYDALAYDTILVEGIVKENNDKFIEKELAKLYNKQISYLLVGFEGSYLSEYVNNNEKRAARIGEYAKKYTNNKLGEICKKLKESEGRKYTDLMDILIENKF